MNEFYERINNLSQKRLVLLAMELQSRLETAERAEKEDTKPEGSEHDAIAIIAMACRYPGGADSPEAFWQLIHDGRDAITEVPRDRWDSDLYYDADPNTPGKMATRWGGFVDQVDQFDPGLFGISPREAIAMDPQQRLMLEVAWETFERAGYAPDRLQGNSTGVFVGACNSDYAQFVKAGGIDNVDMYLATGNAHSVISGRVSYVFGLQGPSITVDTACSSSLTAIHYAIKSLRAGECRMALAGGVNLTLTPEVTITLSQSKMMASDGRCKTFDAAADGFVRSEGCGLILLKRLAEAEADGDPILAVIRGSAINQDGRSNGLTAPNGPSQVAVIRSALADSGMAPGEIGYIETHGTGTSLGDPIEVQALAAALGDGHTKENPLMIGSVKTNMGHLEATAGVVSLMKLVLCLQHAEIPPNLHLQQPSPHIPWQDIPISVPTQVTPWKPINGRRIGGISSFGFSGTNVHMILEDYLPVEDDHTIIQHPDLSLSDEENQPLRLLTMTAKSSTSLHKLAGRYERFLAESKADGGEFAAITHSANRDRAHLSHRLAVIAASAEQARRELSAWAADSQATSVLISAAPVSSPAEVVFLFTGHGAQYAGMGWKLYETQPVFRRVIDRCNQLLLSELQHPLLSAIYPEPGAPDLLAGMAYTQPALFATQMALAELWRSWGIQPAVTAGHSLGEYAAAVVSGVFSLEDGLKLVAARGRLMDSLPQTGSMAAIFTTEAEVAERIRSYVDSLSIAVINAPTNIVISGEKEAVEAVLADFEARGVKSRRLAVAQAAHSPLIEPILDEFEAVASSIQFNAPRISLISCTTGQPVSPAEVTSTVYWRRHLRQPVQFARLMETLRNQSQTLFAEIGPHPVLISIGQRLFPSDTGIWVPSLREGFDDERQMLEALGTLFVNGVEIDWLALNGEQPRPKTLLPTYAFDHQRYWVSHPKKSSNGNWAATPGGSSALLGVRLNSPALEDSVFETTLSAAWPAFLDHHRIYGTALLPSPAYIEMATQAAEKILGAGLYRISNFTIHEALILPEEDLRITQIILKQTDSDQLSFRVVSLNEENQWKTHASGEIFRQAGQAQERRVSSAWIETIKDRCQQELNGEDFYTQVQSLGLEFGSDFRGLQHIWRRDGEALGLIQLPERLVAEAGKYHIHPAFLDACFHLLGAPLQSDLLENAYLLIGIENFTLYRPPTEALWDYVALREQSGETFTADIQLYNEDGLLVAEAQGLQLKRASREVLMHAVRPRFNDWFYTVEWQPHALTPNQATHQEPSTWMIFADQNGVGTALADQLAALGEPYRLIQPGDDLLDNGYLIDLRGLDATASQDLSGEALLSGQVTVCDNALHALQCLLANRDHAARLWLASRGAQPAGHAAGPERSIVEPAQATLWGLGRVIALEHPEIWGGIIDLDPSQTPEEQAASLLAEMQAGTQEDQVAYRQGQRYIARLVRSASPTAPNYAFTPEAAYLIVGGLGGLGLKTAHWFAAQGARHIVLTGRHGLPPRTEWAAAPDSSLAGQVSAIQEIEALGAQVEILPVDAGDFAAMQDLIASFGGARPPLKGVVFAAAALSDHALDRN